MSWPRLVIGVSIALGVGAFLLLPVTVPWWDESLLVPFFRVFLNARYLQDTDSSYLAALSVELLRNILAATVVAGVSLRVLRWKTWNSTADSGPASSTEKQLPLTHTATTLLNLQMALAPLLLTVATVYGLLLALAYAIGGNDPGLLTWAAYGHFAASIGVTAASLIWFVRPMPALTLHRVSLLVAFIAAGAVTLQDLRNPEHLVGLAGVVVSGLFLANAQRCSHRLSAPLVPRTLGEAWGQNRSGMILTLLSVIPMTALLGWYIVATLSSLQS